MICGNKSRILFLLLLVFSGQFCFSLSEEEVQALPDLSKAELIEIIMIYDKTLTTIEEENKTREQQLNAREIELIQREKRSSEREASFQMRESLLVESLKIRKEMERAKFWRGFAIGAGTGFLTGGISGVAVSSQFQ